MVRIHSKPLKCHTKNCGHEKLKMVNLINANKSSILVELKL